MSTRCNSAKELLPLIGLYFCSLLHDAHDLMLIMVTLIYVFGYFSFNIFMFGFMTLFYINFAD